jgi:hypothetical protein
MSFIRGLIWRVKEHKPRVMWFGAYVDLNNGNWVEANLGALMDRNSEIQHLSDT